MIPILYEKTETNFTTNGLGRLSDCISCIVTEERNGIYECEFEYPVTGRLFPYIQEGRIIACTHDEQGDVQPFDIYHRTEPINGVVRFYARHISYRLNEITAKPFTAGSCAQAIGAIPGNSVGTNPFTFWTDKSVTADFISDVPRKIRNLLGGEENSILDVFGTGEYEFDKFTVKFHQHRGQDTNVSIRYGKNLVDYSNDYDAGEAYTAVVPYWIGDVSDSSGSSSVSSTEIVTLPEWYISSGHSVPSGREVIVPMDLSADFDTKPSVSQLRSKATSRLSSSDAWVPNQTMTVNFIQLWQTEEYKDYAPLQRLKLCDTCGIFIPMYNTSVRAKVIKVVYNVLLDRYDSMELGDKPTSYKAVIEKDYDSKVAAILQGFQSIGIDIQNVETNANSYTDGKVGALKNELETQIDAKIETWAQSTDPAASWTTADLKAEHNGDLWLYTGISDTTVGGVTIHPQGTHKYVKGTGNTGSWTAHSSTSGNLFDLADGKTTIFYGPPSGTYSNKQVGDYLVDNTDGATYRWNGTAWAKQTDYNAAIAAATNSITGAYEQAIEDATEQICGGTGGYIITTLNANGQPIELLITDNIDINQAVNVWRWNSGGLGHSHSGYNGPFNDAAITQDGKINASRILTGVLTANLITAGTITDSTGDNHWDLDAGEFVTTKGSIAGLEISDDSLSDSQDGYDFELSREHLTIGYTNSSNINNRSEIGTHTLIFERITSNYDGEIWLSLEGFAAYPVFEMVWYTTYPHDAIFALQHPISNKSYLIEAMESMRVNGNFAVPSQYTKSKECDTENYGTRLQYCYETPTPMFGDIGEAVIGEDGICYVDIDDIFTETIAGQAEYQVFLQKEGEGDCWISDKTPRYFAISGTPGLKVAWELKAKQKNFESIRLEMSEPNLDLYERGSKIDISLDDYITEQEELLYG